MFLLESGKILSICFLLCYKKKLCEIVIYIKSLYVLNLQYVFFTIIFLIIFKYRIS